MMLDNTSKRGLQTLFWNMFALKMLERTYIPSPWYRRENPEIEKESFQGNKVVREHLNEYRTLCAKFKELSISLRFITQAKK